MCGDYLPQCIAFHQRWKAWLMIEDGTPILRMPSEPVASRIFLEGAATSMAELQIATIGRSAELLNAQVFDQRLELLARQSGELFEYLNEAMGFQTAVTVAPVESSRIAELRVLFERLCDCVDELALPNAIIHGDLSLSNILKTSDHWQFIDWCEAYVGNPLSCLQHLLLLNRAKEPHANALMDRLLKDRYRAVMRRACNPECIDRGFTYMPFLAAMSALYGRGSWFTTAQRYEPHRQSYARTITRYLDRAARDPALMDALAG
jgi:hypothetical protein